jgi:hypothetical protein
MCVLDGRSAELVASILSQSETQSVDQSFSRRRMFRNKIKKTIKASRPKEETPQQESLVE